MLSNAARFLMVSAAASLVALGSAPAEACPEIATAAINLIGMPISAGAVLFTTAQKNAWGYTSTDISLLYGNNSPSSALYYDNAVDFFDRSITPAGDDFTPVTSITQVAAGDVLVIDTTGSYSGHTAIVKEPAIPIASINPLIANTSQWALPIIDSTTAVHGCSTAYPDSRFTPSAPGSCAGTFAAGPGTAFMRIYADLTSGALVAYSWSVTNGGPAYTAATRPFVIAKLASCPPF
jgi:hypothetical protein